MELFIGVDVSKAYLDIHIESLSKTFKISNTRAAVQNWIKELGSLMPEHIIKLIVCEATGGYETLLVEFLKAATLPIHVAHANKVRYFARSIGQLAKTDTIDARLLSLYGKTLQPEPKSSSLSPEQLEIQHLIKRRQQLLKQRIEESNRLDKKLPTWLDEAIRKHITFLQDEIKQVDSQIQQMSQSTLQVSFDLLMSIPGVGLITAATILSCLPEIGNCSSSSLAALIGVAPFNQDSGKGHKKRSIYAGRAHIRAALYMATVASLIHNPQLKAFYKKLKDKGKPSKVAIVACMRKLLTIINAVIKRQSPWVEQLNI